MGGARQGRRERSYWFEIRARPRTPPRGDPARPCGTADVSPSSPSRVAGVEEALLAWFDRHGRELPWRRTNDPYALLVSEVMLQQTQVERVVPRYVEWLERWPT